MSEATPAPPPGGTWGAEPAPLPALDARYRIEREIGRGAMGRVYLAFDQKLGRPVAIKVLLGDASDPERARRFEQEARAAGSLSHPNVLAVHDIAAADGRPYIVAELLEGVTLRDHLARGPAGCERAAEWGAQIARGLAAAHERGIVHRDLKPENLFLTREGVVKILDFGIAKLTEGDAIADGTRTGVVLGTLGYMSPEQARGRPATAKSDLFSLGAILFELVTGTRAFEGAGPLETAWAIANDPPRALPADVPATLSRCIERCLEKDPMKRPGSAREVASALDALRAGDFVPLRPTPPLRRRRLALLAIPVAAAAALIGFASLRRAAPSAGAEPTAAMEAYRRYFEGRKCSDRGPSPSPACIALFKEAVDLDPTLAMAWHSIAYNGLWLGAPRPEVEEAAAGAMANRHRAPRADQLQIEAFDAQLHGREDDAAALFRQAADLSEDDRTFLLLAADFFLTRNEADLALPFLERSAELGEHSDSSVTYLAAALANTRRLSQLRQLRERLERGPQNSPVLIALVMVRAFLGDGSGAIEAGRRALELAPTDELRADAARFLNQARIQFRDPDIGAELVDDCGNPYYAAVYLVVHGRNAEAGALLERGERKGCPPLSEDERRSREQRVLLQAGAAALLTGDGDAERMWPFAERARAINPTIAAALAVNFAYVGDLARAEQLAAPLYPGSPRRLLYEATVQWRRGQTEAALSTLRMLSARNPYSAPPPTIAPVFLYALLLAESGDPAGAIEALETFRRGFDPIGHQWAWTHPRALLLEAECHERLGDRRKARASVDQLLSLLQNADERLPLLARARALRRRL